MKVLRAYLSKSCKPVLVTKLGSAVIYPITGKIGGAIIETG